MYALFALHQIFGYTQNEFIVSRWIFVHLMCYYLCINISVCVCLCSCIWLLWRLWRVMLWNWISDCCRARERETRWRRDWLKHRSHKHTHSDTHWTTHTYNTLKYTHTRSNIHSHTNSHSKNRAHTHTLIYSNMHSNTHMKKHLSLSVVQQWCIMGDCVILLRSDCLGVCVCDKKRFTVFLSLVTQFSRFHYSFMCQLWCARSRSEEPVNDPDFCCLYIMCAALHSQSLDGVKMFTDSLRIQGVYLNAFYWLNISETDKEWEIIMIYEKMTKCRDMRILPDSDDILQYMKFISQWGFITLDYEILDNTSTVTSVSCKHSIMTPSGL